MAAGNSLSDSEADELGSDETTLTSLLRTAPLSLYDRVWLTEESPTWVSRFESLETIQDQLIFIQNLEEHINEEEAKEDLFNRIPEDIKCYFDSADKLDGLIDKLIFFDVIEKWMDDSFNKRIKEELDHIYVKHGLGKTSHIANELAKRLSSVVPEEAPPRTRGVVFGSIDFLSTTMAELEREHRHSRRAHEQDEQLNAMRERAREQLALLEERISSMGELMSAPTGAISWNGTQEQLAYLLSILQKAGFIGDANLWALAERSFVRADGRPFSRVSMKSAASKLGIGKGGSSSTRADELDRLVEQVLGLRGGLPLG